MTITAASTIWLWIVVIARARNSWRAVLADRRGRNRLIVLRIRTSDGVSVSDTAMENRASASSPRRRPTMARSPLNTRNITAPLAMRGQPNRMLWTITVRSNRSR